MRIQHNLPAMNSQRRLRNNNALASKNLEKLSSGFRVNRAGDDAAGLAISEKMRAQIRGLDTASRNAQDGIGLVKTAEGALQEEHAMLQRLTELAMEAANGIYGDEERAHLDKEFQQLKAELDRIAGNTDFNGIKLLDGSYAQGAVRSAQMSGITMGSQLVPVQKSITSNITNVLGGKEGSVAISVDTSGVRMHPPSEWELIVKINDETHSAIATCGAAEPLFGNDALAVFNGVRLRGDGGNSFFDVAVSGGKMTFTACDGQFGKINSAELILLDTLQYNPIIETVDCTMQVNLGMPANAQVLHTSIASGSAFTPSDEWIKISMKVAGQVIVFMGKGKIPSSSANDWLESAFQDGAVGRNADMIGEIWDDYFLLYEDGKFSVVGGGGQTFTESSFDSAYWNSSLSMQQGNSFYSDSFSTITNDQNGIIRTNPAITPGSITGTTASDTTLRLTIDPASFTLSPGDYVFINMIDQDGVRYQEILPSITSQQSQKGLKALLLSHDIILDNGAVLSPHIDPSNGNNILFQLKSGNVYGSSTLQMQIEVDSFEEGIYGYFTPGLVTIPPEPDCGWEGNVSENSTVIPGGDSGLAAGDVLTVGGQKYELVSSSGTKKDPAAREVLWTGSLSALVPLLQTAVNANGGDYTISVYSSGGEEGITVTQRKSTAGDVSVSLKSIHENTVLSVDASKMQAGDTLSLALGLPDGTVKKVSYTHADGKTIQDIFALIDAAAGSSGGVSLAGSNITIENTSLKMSFAPAADSTYDNALVLQIGAGGGEIMRINIPGMGAENLGLGNTSASTLFAAQNAIDEIKSAINQISSVRAGLGALQNRLEHTISNLGTSMENLTAAESRIRDTDMANEMMNFTKNNILTQAAQSMLAQANLLPGNVLELLQ